MLDGREKGEYTEELKRLVAEKQAEINEKFNVLKAEIEAVGSRKFFIGERRPTDKDAIILRELLKRVKEAEYLDSDQKIELTNLIRDKYLKTPSGSNMVKAKRFEKESIGYKTEEEKN